MHVDGRRCRSVRALAARRAYGRGPARETWLKVSFKNLVSFVRGVLLRLFKNTAVSYAEDITAGKREALTFICRVRFARLPLTVLQQKASVSPVVGAF